MGKKEGNKRPSYGIIILKKEGFLVRLDIYARSELCSPGWAHTCRRPVERDEIIRTRVVFVREQRWKWEGQVRYVLTLERRALAALALAKEEYLDL